MNRTSKKQWNRTTLYRISAVIFALVLWEIVSLLVNADYLLASPIQVIKRFVNLIFEADFLKTLLFSFLRMTAGFLVALLLGILMAVLASRYEWIEYLLWPLVVSIKSVPIASFIILFLLWLDFNTLTIFIALLIVFPVVYTNVLQGIKSADPKLREVADLYHVPFKRRLLYMYIPSIKPFLLSACNVGIGMAWKAGIAAEVIGVLDGSIGGKLYEAKIYFLNEDLLAWTVVIILMSVLSEKILTGGLKVLFRRIERI